MNKKGFTLIELIAVIVILGMLLLVVMPATSRIMASNDQREYDEYYKLIKYAAYKYARGRQQDLGGVTSNGCIEAGINLTTFIGEELLKPFSKNEEDVTCMVPSESKILPNKNNYYDIRIINDKGTITVKHSLVCERGGRIVYQNLYKKDGTACKKFEPAKVTDFYTYLTTNNSLTGVEGQTRYINTSNNYVKYSGKLWRIVSVNTDKRNVKMISDEILTYLNYDELDSSKFNNSNADEWMNSMLKGELRNPYVYLQISDWYYSRMEQVTSTLNMAASAPKATDIVGLLNLHEFNKVKTFINEPNGNDWFLLTPQNDTLIWSVDRANNPAITNTTTFKGIRPCVVLRTGITFQSGGNGTKDNPYVIIGEQTGLSGDKLNSRFAGEYVSFENVKYRITGTSNSGTTIYTSQLSFNEYFDNTNKYMFTDSCYSGSKLYSSYYIKLANKNKVNRIEYCNKMYISNNKFTKSCSDGTSQLGYYKLPAIGDFYAVPNSDNYWLSSYSDETAAYNTWITNKVQMMTPTGITAQKIRTYGKLYPVIELNTDVKIKSGTGTNNNPYVVG